MFDLEIDTYRKQLNKSIHEISMYKPKRNFQYNITELNRQDSRELPHIDSISSPRRNKVNISEIVRTRKLQDKRNSEMLYQNRGVGVGTYLNGCFRNYHSPGDSLDSVDYPVPTNHIEKVKLGKSDMKKKTSFAE
jgi:hypothetical protein